MLPLNDPRWNTYLDALGQPYDAPAMLRRVLSSMVTRDDWDECWNHIAYQEDIGQVSYAAAPYLQEYVRTCSRLDWEPIGLIATVELARPDGPEMPTELADSYFETIRTLPLTLLKHADQSWDMMTTRCVAACIAFAKGHRQLGRVYLELGVEEALQCLAQLDE